MNTRKTIAIQADDPEFIARYEERVKQSGKTVKNYLMDIINADIENPDQSLNKQSAKDIDMAAFIRDPDLLVEFQERLDQIGKPQEEYLIDLIKADISRVVQTAEAVIPQETGELPSQDTGITNLFVKITREQREALECQKNETGEPVGKMLNRLINDFLDAARNESFAEGFEETYQYYEGIAGECDTTCSAKIPSQNNQELFAYLESTGKSRNVLMASLVHMELYGQDMEEEQGQGMSIQL